jgi:flavin-dependent dehydrogenase
MREKYDFIVIGLGPAACLVTRLLAEAGGRVAMLRGTRPTPEDVSDWIDYWLAPLNESAAKITSLFGDAFPSLESISQQIVDVEDIGATVSTETPVSQRCAVLAVEDFRSACQAALADVAGVRVLRHWRLDQFLLAGEQVVGVEAVERDGTRRPLYAPMVIDARGDKVRTVVRPDAPGVFDVIAWGRYLDVTRQTNSPTASVLTFTGSSGSRFWLLPIDETETHLGVEATGLPASRLTSAAQVWEDELVGCPELAQRLMHAKLLDACDFRHLTYTAKLQSPVEGMVTLAELDAPTPLAFRWAILENAAQMAETILRDNLLSSPTEGGG